MGLQPQAVQAACSARIGLPRSLYGSTGLLDPSIWAQGCWLPTPSLQLGERTALCCSMDESCSFIPAATRIKLPALLSWGEGKLRTPSTGLESERRQQVKPLLGVPASQSTVLIPVPGSVLGQLPARHLSDSRRWLKCFDLCHHQGPRGSS